MSFMTFVKIYDIYGNRVFDNSVIDLLEYFMKLGVRWKMFMENIILERYCDSVEDQSGENCSRSDSSRGNIDLDRASVVEDSYGF